VASQTYLQLCQAVHRLVRAGNQAGGTRPTAIPPQAGSDQAEFDIVDMVPRAYEWIQNAHPSWNFMRQPGQLILTAGLRSYPLALIQSTIPTYYGFIPFWATTTSPYFLLFDNGAPLASRTDYIYPFIEYQEWRGWWDRNPRPTGLQPNRMTERPDRTLEFDPTPGTAPSGSQWAVRFDFRVTNEILATSGQLPTLLPAEFQDLIIWVAVRMFCESRMNMGPLYQSALKEIDDRLGRLQARYLPQLQIDLSYA
jgi:hypothetical protein